MEDQEWPGCDGRLQKVAAIYETLINYNGWCITQNSLIIESESPIRLAAMAAKWAGTQWAECVSAWKG